MCFNLGRPGIDRFQKETWKNYLSSRAVHLKKMNHHLLWIKNLSITSLDDIQCKCVFGCELEMIFFSSQFL